MTKLKQNGILDISISGGEPFIFNEIYELIDYAVDIGIDVVILSNGTKIDFNHISTLRKIKGIHLSIDGPNEKINDEIRGEGVYNKVLETLDKLFSNGIPVIINMVLFNKYFEEYKLYMETFLNELKDKYGNSVKICFTTEILPGRDITIDKHSMLHTQYLQKFIDSVCKKVYGNEWLVQKYTEYLNRTFHTDCGYGNVITIDNIGRVYPCSLTYYPIGNIYEETISNFLLKIKDLNENFKVDNLEPCSKCDLKYICGGKCRVLNMYLYNSMHKIECNERYVKKLQQILVDTYPFLYTTKGE